MLGEKWTDGLPSGRVRAFNLWILQRGSIQANTLPSAHVAITGACALSLLRLGPQPAGLIFLWIAVSIALGAVSGRYHYALDAILGFLVAGAALLAGSISLP
jgi:membrane-associated phospholipid phosphatase